MVDGCLVSAKRVNVSLGLNTIQLELQLTSYCSTLYVVSVAIGHELSGEQRSYVFLLVALCLLLCTIHDQWVTGNIGFDLFHLGIC